MTITLLKIWLTEHQGEGDEYDVERAIQMSLESFQAQSQAHVGSDDASANIVHESPSPAYAKTGADSDKTTSGEEKTVELDQGQAGSNPGKTPESRPLPEQEFIKEDQAGPNIGSSRSLDFEVLIVGYEHVIMNCGSAGIRFGWSNLQIRED
nr:hypothetical protein [Tanacetum cinerariifolium]